jgi:hypothetical protein
VIGTDCLGKTQNQTPDDQDHTGGAGTAYPSGAPEFTPGF